MKEKLYHFYGTAIDKNGLPHIVTIVGKLTQQKENEIVIEDMQVNDEYGDKKYEGQFTYEKSKKIRRLTYAFSICHTDDVENFSEDKGIEIAKRRLTKFPLGKLETDTCTTLCDDQVKWILFGELKFIMDNIDDFIEKI